VPATSDTQLSQPAVTISVVRDLAAGAAEAADSDDLANQYEFLVLYDLPVPVDLDQKLRDAHRRVHLRGLDPLDEAAC
jgi:hypothetical protein